MARNGKDGPSPWGHSDWCAQFGVGWGVPLHGPGLVASPKRKPTNISTNQKSLCPQKFTRNCLLAVVLVPSHSALLFRRRLSMRFIWSSNLCSKTAPRLCDWWSILLSKLLNLLVLLLLSLLKAGDCGRQLLHLLLQRGDSGINRCMHGSILRLQLC